MRTQEDLIEVNVMTIRSLSVDMEQLECSPRFRNTIDTIRSTFPEADDNIVLDLAIKDYLLDYIRTNEFPYKTPGTTGPGTVTQIQVEVVRNANQARDDGSN